PKKPAWNRQDACSTRIMGVLDAETGFRLRSTSSFFTKILLLSIERWLKTRFLWYLCVIPK
ncbi:hypothetical protein, partial [Tychonema bourrellyi]|uniref:hypothetical protein n=1 Tax=Tychonema bourrellyi TaxID=54313 RepID=UPI001C55842C